MNEASIGFVYFVPKWKNQQCGFTFLVSPSGFKRKGTYSGLTDLYYLNRTIPIPIDPLTAIGLGLVTPQEIGLPEGLQAAFNLLK